MRELFEYNDHGEAVGPYPVSKLVKAGVTISRVQRGEKRLLERSILISFSYKYMRSVDSLPGDEQLKQFVRPHVSLLPLATAKSALS